MRKIILLLVCLSIFSTRESFALEGWYLGGQLGHVALLGDVKNSRNNALGFGLDVGVKATSIIDILLSFQTSSHDGGGGLTVYAPYMTADIHVGRAYDFDFTLGFGPGLYLFKTPAASLTAFGLHGGGAVDVLIDEHLKVGLGARYHGVLSPTVDSGSFWTVMMRVGYFFGS